MSFVFVWSCHMFLTQGVALVICPILAGEGALGGLRGEYRRIEDKFVSLQMELKNVQISFDLTNTHGNRIAPFLVYTINNMFGLFTFFKFHWLSARPRGLYLPICQHGWLWWSTRWVASRGHYGKLRETQKGTWRIPMHFAEMTFGVMLRPKLPSHSHQEICICFGMFPFSPKPNKICFIFPNSQDRGSDSSQGEYVTPESTTFLSHEGGRSLTEAWTFIWNKNWVLGIGEMWWNIDFGSSQDKEETAQWISSPSTLSALVESCLSRVSTLKGQVLLVHHLSQYEGNLEKVWGTIKKCCSFSWGWRFFHFPQVVLDWMQELGETCYVTCYSQTSNPAIFAYSLMQAKDKLLQDGNGFSIKRFSWFLFCFCGWNYELRF